jgi:hypothetical protein
MANLTQALAACSPLPQAMDARDDIAAFAFHDQIALVSGVSNVDLCVCVSVCLCVCVSACLCVCVSVCLSLDLIHRM